MSDSLLSTNESFVRRHIGTGSKDVAAMLNALGLDSLDALIQKTIPKALRLKGPLNLPEDQSEAEVLEHMRTLAKMNEVYKSYIGLGYYDTITPPVIQRNILENPGWYTQYTPYQAEIAQGRLEALLNFQTMISDLTGLPVANASLLDEGTAAAEAMNVCFGQSKNGAKKFFVSEKCFPQTIEVVKGRALPAGIEVVVGNHESIALSSEFFGVLVQYPCIDGEIFSYKSIGEKIHAQGGLFVVAADLLSLALLTPPGEFGADLVVGSTQRFGVPMGYGGPHAAYLSTIDELKRLIPGRIVGVTKDANGKRALRLALQTREQHIRREKATSNICTAQVLLAIMASMYGVYHGEEGLKRIAKRIHKRASYLADCLKSMGIVVSNKYFFDTVHVKTSSAETEKIIAEARKHKINFCVLADKTLSISLDETTSETDVKQIISVFATAQGKTDLKFGTNTNQYIPSELVRKSSFMTHEIFKSVQSETEILRYIHKLQAKDLSLTTSMIPLGSCTMKLNATAELMPITWPEFNKIHPFAPKEQAAGYREMFIQFEKQLAEITGFHGVSLQPNAGSQGEYAGLLVIRKFQEKNKQQHRDVCLIPKSAHGTNPASAAMAGLKVVPVNCDKQGNIDVADLKEKAELHKNTLSALMVTYPSTHGVFEDSIKDICSIVHANGGQVYMDGANMNALVGLCKPAEFGADVVHLNLHKTFCIPHGGGGPGMGPICVAEHLTPHLPGHEFACVGTSESVPAISAAPWGSASILPISYIYILLMGGKGLKLATEVAILNANYIAKRLENHYPVLYKGAEGLVAHECIIDLRPVNVSAGIQVDDIAKRLMDYGFHAPTVSWPVAGTIMVEPTESESKDELDRFCSALISIREEIKNIENGKWDKLNNPLKHAPHTAEILLSDAWDRPYTRNEAAYPAAWVRQNKFWPSVSRVDNAYGDRNLVCSCPPMEDYE